ncbi:MAG TPA: rhomboid family intramembrane serine protease [Verrucomicrobiae bacterium]|nr:rhomboid family intramembrane serine protease [Verrucomicrobiae bacterium]
MAGRPLRIGTDDMEETRIPARSRRQAMDWSLVLVSQGIEAIIEQSETDGAWGLLIPARDSEKALKSLRQYRLENRNWPWQQKLLPWPEVHFDPVAALWVLLLILIHWLAAAGALELRAAGTLYSSAVLSGQWWRIFTSMTLHADIAHLAANLSIGVVLLGLAMGRYGTGVGFLAAYLAGAGGNLASLWLNSRPFYGMGASGMVMGALGLLAAQSLATGKHDRRPMKYLRGGIAAGIMLFILFGLSPSPGTDVAAHIGGFVTGLLLGMGLAFTPMTVLKNSKTNFLAGFTFAVLVAMTWRLALNAGKLL